jgi:hypothetical protein
VLGADVDIVLHTYDETNRRVRPQQIIRMIQKSGGKALIGLVGVQSNQFPRAVDLARVFLRAGLPVSIGGFHVSGCVAMLPELPQDIRDARPCRLFHPRGNRRRGFNIPELVKEYQNRARIHKGCVNNTTSVSE